MVRVRENWGRGYRVSGFTSASARARRPNRPAAGPSPSRRACPDGIPLLHPERHENSFACGFSAGSDPAGLGYPVSGPSCSRPIYPWSAFHCSFDWWPASGRLLCVVEGGARIETLQTPPCWTSISVIGWISRSLPKFDCHACCASGGATTQGLRGSGIDFVLK
jgi:hypothetical protein